MSVIQAVTPPRGVLALPPVKRGLLCDALLRKDAKLVSFAGGKHLEDPTTLTVDADSTFIARKDPWYVTDATLNTLRCEHEGGLLEAQRINLCLRAEELATNPPWVPTNCTVTADDTTAPDGNNTADKVEDNGAASEIHQILAGGTLTDNLGYVTSVFVREGTAVEFTLTLRDDGAAADRARSDFQWVAGALTIKAQDVGTAFVRRIGRAGWYRATIRVPINQIVGANAHRILIYPTEDGGGAVGLYHHFWGAQLEQNGIPTSYIPTAAASVTGNQDILIYDNAADKHCKPAAGTIMIAFAPEWEAGELATGTVRAIVDTRDLANQNGILLANFRVTGLYNVQVRSGGGNVANLTSITAGLRHVPNVLGVTWQLNEFRLYVDGNLEGSDLLGAAPAGQDDITLGSFTNGNNPNFGNYSYLAIYDHVLDITEIQLNTREFQQWLQS